MGLTTRPAAPDVAAGLVAVAAALASSPWWRRRRRPARNVDAVAQAIAAWGALCALPAVVVAAVAGRRWLGVAAALVGVGGLGQLAWINGRRDRDEPAAVPTVRIAHCNLWCDNRTPAAAAATIESLDVDVLTLSEFTPDHRRRLRDRRVDEAYPYRLERARSGPAGMAIWSRHPLTEMARRPLHHERLAATVNVGDLSVLIDTLHARSPMMHARAWGRDLQQLAGEPAPTDGAAVMIGDFNAAWTHPGFRAIARQGWRDAHRDRGQGRRNSWRADRHWLPLFVRLDHALVNAHLAVIAVEDVTLPGSDHRGLIVTVAPVVLGGRRSIPPSGRPMTGMATRTPPRWADLVAVSRRAGRRGG